MKTIKIAIVAGSNRAGASSTKLCRYMAEVLAKQHAASVEVLELHQLVLPLYSPDDETEHEAVGLLRRAVADADGIVLATPEYHGSMSGVLKNALDYLGADEFRDKAVLAVSSSGGAVGVSSLQHIQTVVRNLHGINSPEWISIGGEQRAFGEDGAPANAKMKERIERVLAYFAGMTRMLRG